MLSSPRSHGGGTLHARGVPCAVGTPTRFGSKLTGPRDVAYKTGLRLQTD